MRAALLVAAACALLACSPEVEQREATQIMVRITASVEVMDKLDSLNIQVAVPGEGARWVARKPTILPVGGLAWPVDVPVIPGEGHARNGRFEVVARARDPGGELIAEARAITNFVPEEQRVLPLHLSICEVGPGKERTCNAAGCFGDECKVCSDGECVPVPALEGERLSALGADAGTQAQEPPPADDAGSDAGCTDERRCVGNRLEVCQSGAFELEQVCAFTCQAGECSGECDPTSYQCDGNMREQCSSTGEWEDLTLCSDLCREGVCETLPSCEVDLKCADNESCCTSRVVPAGEYFRSYDGEEYAEKIYPAKVSAFRMDKYEVTVGRFRKWLAAYDQPGARPRAGAGKNPSNGDDLGWEPEWGAFLPATADALRAQLAECEDTTWTEQAEGNEDRPVNCVTWYEALAFCIWDHGRLPTEAEWNHAAAGGAEQRIFPWSTQEAPSSIDDSYAVYYPAAISDVGKKPKGNAKWGHADLGGNLQEWVEDWYREDYRISNCDDCAELVASDSRVIRGGSFRYLESGAYASFRDSLGPEIVSGKVGVRCVRDP